MFIIASIQSSLQSSSGSYDSAGSSVIEEENRLLIMAAEEGNRLLKIRNRHNIQTSEMEELSVQDIHIQIEALIDTSDCLLDTTVSTQSLASAVSRKRNESAGRVTSLRRAFLTANQWCLSLLPLCENDELRNQVLDRALTLATRTYDLGMFFYLPLYERLSAAVARHSINPLPWIQCLASWADTEMGPLEENYFNQPLIALCRRQRLADVAQLIRGMRIRHKIHYIDGRTTVVLLNLLRGFIRPLISNGRDVSSVEKDALEVMLSLEPSLWKMLENPIASQDRNMRDRMEVILTGDDDARISLQTLEQLLDDAFDPTMELDIENHQAIDDDMDDGDSGSGSERKRGS